MRPFRSWTLKPDIELIAVVCQISIDLVFFGNQTGKPTLQNNVYASRVVPLKLLTGRRAEDLSQGPNDQNLALQVRNVLNDRKKLRKVIDPKLSQNLYTLEPVAMFANLASRCFRPNSTERPSVEECVRELQLILHTNSKGLGMALHKLGLI
ncbi:hypothetical protein CRG98_032386 [Punica granatum]|uniref:Serine-threonine/tyrosine-protein kinase catalytic domain-containing protein n=1 Tax=Punica granatum TaxID=22663 RepID=A0A2I0ITC7_PUNGR|nr:hypothetical protein CRG98_032386 [Punica granatum]